MKPFATITWLGGSTPVQGEGTLRDGTAFSFSARGQSWELSVTDESSMEIWCWCEPYGDQPYEAGYMPEDIARTIVESCAEMYTTQVAPPIAYAGVAQGEVHARRLAQLIRADILCYADVPASGVISRDALAAPLAEARTLFAERVAPGLRHVFDEEIGDLDALAERRAKHPRWLSDAGSARSVGTRWASMLRLLDPSARTAASAQGDRWFPRWTADDESRDALVRAMRSAA